MKKGDEYQCAVCGNTFITGWDDEEAITEYEATFDPNEPSDIVCDDCYRKMGFGRH